MEDEDHQKGHRDRLRERFLKAPDTLPEYEILELLLFGVVPRADTKPLAKRLIKQFGSLQGVLFAEYEQLQHVQGIGRSSGTFLKAIHAAAVCMARQHMLEQPTLNSWDAVLNYCRLAMGGLQREQFRVLFLNLKNRLIADEALQIGTIDQAPVYPREILKRALELSASALILIHNHPSGDPTPSQQDIEATQQLKRAAQPLGIVIQDHLIISRYDFRSLRSLGHV